MDEVNAKMVDSELPGLPQITPESAAYLMKAAKWSKFLAILGFIITGLMAVAGVLMSFVLGMLKDEMIPLSLPVSPVILSILYIFIAGIFLIPVLFLNSFSNNAIKAINLGDTAKMTTSLRNLKNLIVFIGISVILFFALYTIILIVVGVAAVIGF
jgi:hypothetical protein